MCSRTVWYEKIKSCVQCFKDLLNARYCLLVNTKIAQRSFVADAGHSSIIDVNPCVGEQYPDLKNTRGELYVFWCQRTTKELSSVSHVGHAMDDLELKKRPVSKSLANQDEANYTRHCKERNTQALPSDRAVWIVFFSLLVDLLAFTVILPLFPSLLEFYANNKQVSETCRIIIGQSWKPLLYNKEYQFRDWSWAALMLEARSQLQILCGVIYSVIF